jgi:hypothetical protein
MAEYRGLGFDPAPGSADAVMAASQRCGDAASSSAGTASSVRRAAETASAQWTGDAAQIFVARLERVPGELDSAREVLRAAADILDDWASTLVANQREADRLDRRALLLRRDIITASDEADRTATFAQFTTGFAASGAQADNRAAVARHEALQRELDRILDDARVLERDHHAAAARVTDRLRALAGGRVDAATLVPGMREEFAGLIDTLDTFSSLGSGLAAALLGAPSGGGAAITGGAGAFAAAVGGARPAGPPDR